MVHYSTKEVTKYIASWPRARPAPPSGRPMRGVERSGNGCVAPEVRSARAHPPVNYPPLYEQSTRPIYRRCYGPGRKTIASSPIEIHVEHERFAGNPKKHATPNPNEIHHDDKNNASSSGPMYYPATWGACPATCNEPKNARNLPFLRKSVTVL